MEVSLEIRFLERVDRSRPSESLCSAAATWATAVPRRMDLG